MPNEDRPLPAVPNKGQTRYKVCPKCTGLYDDWYVTCLSCKIKGEPVKLEQATDQMVRDFERYA
jgi:hypothetical protein